MTHRKKLIEVALPLEAINQHSVRENYIYKGNPSAVHKWWSGKPLAAARAVIFASLVDDPDNPSAPLEFVEACRRLHKGKHSVENDTPRMRLFDFIERLVQWESMTDESVISTAQELVSTSTGGNNPVLFDPFAGGGSIPLEAQRLGLAVYASDLNPVAVSINKALIEIPPRFSGMPPVNPHDRSQLASGEGWRGAAGIAADVRYYGDLLWEKAWERIGHLYPQHNHEMVIAWLWTRTVKSPNPAIDMFVPLTSKFELSSKKGKRVWVEPIADTLNKRVSFIVRREANGDSGKPLNGTVNRRGGSCIVTGVPIPFDYIRAEGRAGRIGASLMAIVTENANGRNYHSPTIEHEFATKVSIPESAPDTELPEQALGFRVQLYGMTLHRDLFTARQLVALVTLSEIVQEIQELAYEDALSIGLEDDNRPLRQDGRGAKAYAEAITVFLSFAINKYAAYGCSLALWYAKEDRPKGIFASQSLPMAWDYVEINPFADIGGALRRSIEIVADAIPSLLTPTEGVVFQSDVSTLKLDIRDFLISTDPPYYDSVGYADLSDFYYIWLRRNLRQIYPEIFGTMLVPKVEELVATPYRFGGNRSTADLHFENGLQSAFSNLRYMSNPQFPMTIYYAFKQSESKDDDEPSSSTDEKIRASTGWETMLQGLVRSGFIITGTIPIHTERRGRMISVGTNALASSIVLVCRPRPDDAPTTSRRAFLSALRQELPAALKDLQSGNIAPVDLAQASIGPGMAIYSRYSAVLEADGSPMSVRTALGLINQELDAYLAEQDGDIDGDTRFAVAWFEQFGFKEGEFGQADVLARAKNTSVEGVVRAGLVESGRGKVRLRHWSEYDPGAWNPQEDKRPTVWEGVHHLIERLNSHGETGAAMLLLKMPHEMAAEARQLAYRLYNICERKNWADHARDYNALVISWAGVGEEGARLREAAAAGQATQQLGLFGDE